MTKPFVTGIRNLVLAMWWCAIIVEVLGRLIVFRTAERGGAAPLASGMAVATPLIAAVAIALAGATSFSVRRQYR